MKNLPDDVHMLSQPLTTEEGFPYDLKDGDKHFEVYEWLATGESDNGD